VECAGEEQVPEHDLQERVFELEPLDEPAHRFDNLRAQIAETDEYQREDEAHQHEPDRER